MNITPLGLILAGPCSAESREQVFEVARSLSRDGRTSYLRAGVWKPRTHPGQFEGMGEVALSWLAEAQQETGIKVCIEVARAEHVALAHRYGIHSFWIGARTTSDPFAVQEVAEALGKADGPFFVKNPISPDIELWMGAIERLAAHTSQEVMAVHRGFFPTRKIAYRNAPEWELPLQLRSRYGHRLRILCDPSHIAGKREWVAEIAQQAMNFAFDGLMIEVHPSPENALSDARQQLTLAAFFQLLDTLLPPPQMTEVLDADLEHFRRKIDSIDVQVLDLLGERLAVVRDIGVWKAERGIQAFHQERWRELLKHHLRYGLQLGLDTHFVRRLCELVHTESLRLQGLCCEVKTSICVSENQDSSHREREKHGGESTHD